MQQHTWMRLAGVCLLTALASTGSLSAQELTTNGDFETGDTSGWVSFPTPNSTFNITTDANSGAWAAELFNNDEASSAVVKQANLGVGVVNPGDLIDISFAVRGEGVIGGVLFAEFFSEIDGGGVSASQILGGAPLMLDLNNYQTFNFQTTAGPDVSGGVTLQFAAVTGAATGSVIVAFIDDVSVSRVIPEPASATLAALLGVAGLVARRRRSC